MANEQNLINGEQTQFRSGEEAVRNGRAGGIASGKARREKATIAAALRKVLDERDADGITKREKMVAKVAKRLFDDGDIRDLKVATEILGELKTNVQIDGGITVVAKDAVDKQQQQDFLDDDY